MKYPASRITASLGLVLALGLTPVAAQDNAVSKNLRQSANKCSAVITQDNLTTVSDDGDMTFVSGKSARLSGLRLPETAFHRQRAVDFMRTYIGKAVSLESLDERDRWGRMSVNIKHFNGKDIVELNHLLVEAGLALVDPGGKKSFCQLELLAFEETAREQHLGLWAEARYNPISAERNALLQEQVGSFVIVEGQVRSVGERKQTTYLNFGGHWAEDFTIIIPRNVWTRMAQSGLDAAALKGRRIRARGILQSWQGTALTIEMPEMIERLEGNRLPR